VWLIILLFLVVMETIVFIFHAPEHITSIAATCGQILLWFQVRGFMELRAIIKEVDKEISLLQQARALLTESGKQSHIVVQRKKRKLSPEARKRIADAQRKRWAASKKA
jgi:hypothetical protein